MREITIVNKGHDPTHEIVGEPDADQISVYIFIFKTSAMQAQVMAKTGAKKHKTNPRENGKSCVWSLDHVLKDGGNAFREVIWL